MFSQKIARYDAPHQFEPLMPEERFVEPLLEQASDLIREATGLGSATAAQSELGHLLRAMNSYYTNKIEGEHTRPSEIERALQMKFSDNADVARKQRLAVAHIATERACEEAIDLAKQDPGVAAKLLYSRERVEWLHRQLFQSLTEADLRLADGTLLVPGELRHRRVAVGMHEAPWHEALPAFIARWAQVYGSTRRGELAVVAAAASHHRLAWIHPFADGNGRVTRLHTHLALHAMGLTKGLWSPLRGFARTEELYRAHLRAADEHRRGDLDGRGNLTQQGLVAWIEYTIATCLDQVRFMSGQLAIGSIRDRIKAALIFEESTRTSGVRQEALGALHYLFATQSELARADFKAMTGLGERTASGLTSALIKSGYLASNTPYGPVRFAVPRHVLRFYFPNLWPEAERDPDMLKPAPAIQAPKAAVLRAG